MRLRKNGTREKEKGIELGGGIEGRGGRGKEGGGEGRAG